MSDTCKDVFHILYSFACVQHMQLYILRISTLDTLEHVIDTPDTLAYVQHAHVWHRHRRISSQRVRFNFFPLMKPNWTLTKENTEA